MKSVKKRSWMVVWLNFKAAGYEAIWHGQKGWNGVPILGRGVAPVESMRGVMDPALISWRRISAFVATGLLMVFSVLGVEAREAPVTNCIRQVDHVLVASSDANQLFALLTESFELPVVWPMARYGTFASGGVSLGNVNLEIIQANGSSEVAQTHYTGLALEPEPLDTVVPLLAARSIARGKVMPFRSWDGFIPKKLWTTVSLPSVSSDALSVFLCQYELDTSARRHTLNEQLRARKGGPLTVVSVREVVIGISDAPGVKNEWEKLLLPAKPDSSDTWKLSAGPAIRLTRSQKTGIQRLVIEISSIVHAREFIKARGWDVTEEDGALLLTTPLLKDLNLFLVPARK